MPSKNVVKQYIPGGLYHVYNRGVNKQEIFFDESDYYLLCNMLENSLSILKQPKNFYGKIFVHAYCFMPNHIHILLEQKDVSDMFKFMQSLQVSYTLHINRRHNRVGHLFQGRYKARLLRSDIDFLTATEYIHKNPSKIFPDIFTYKHSSLSCYANKKLSFVTTSRLLSYFDNSSEYYREYIAGRVQPSDL